MTRVARCHGFASHSNSVGESKHSRIAFTTMAKEPRVRLQSGHGFMPSYEKLPTHSDLSSKFKTLVEFSQTLHSFCQNSTRMNWTSCRHRSNSLQVNPPRTEPRCFYKSDASRWILVTGASPHATVCGTQRMRSTVYSGVSDKIPTGLSEHS